MSNNIKCIKCGETILAGLFTEMAHYSQCLGAERYGEMLNWGELYRNKLITYEELNAAITALMESDN